jgi:uncharacterized OB-fold protein
VNPGTTRAAGGSSKPVDDYWLAGAEGELRLARCRTCRRWLHPPRPLCPRCRGRDIGREPVSGKGTVWSYTVSRYGWAGLEPPYLVAEVELEEQPGLRVMTTIVDCEDVRIGQPVSARFEYRGDVWVPVFAP